MQDLPWVRDYEVAPFTHYRADMFRLFKMRERRSNQKWYCALFTGFTNQAFHIERGVICNGQWFIYPNSENIYWEKGT